MPTVFIAQLIGVCAVLISLLIFQFNKRPVMLRLGMTAAVFYAIHFFLLGAFTGAAMNLIGAFRCYVFYKMKPGKSNAWILFLFLGIAAIAALLTWHGYLSLLAMAGSMLSGVAFWQKNPKIIRRIALIVPPLWFAYNMAMGSYPGMFIEAVMFMSNIIGQYRFDFGQKVKAKPRLARTTASPDS